MSGEVLSKSVVASSVESILSIYDSHFAEDTSAITNKKKQVENLKEKRQDQASVKSQQDF